jgi:DNA-binding LytR/AlgR family response regulator
MNTKRLKALVVDDELPARERLISLLSKFAELEKIEGASGADEALALIPLFKPEVVFLDIQMPDVDGIALATKIMETDEPPIVVFVTAYDRYFIEAFEVNAIDYVLKPANPERLATSIERVMGIIETREKKDQFLDDLSLALNKILEKP